MTPPIVIAAFGTSTKAMDTYDKMSAVIESQLPDHEIHWSFTSRYVMNRLKKRKAAVKQPQEILSELRDKGHDWAVVQSLHIICGHEFYRMVREVQMPGIRTSIGLPLLLSPTDYQEVGRALEPLLAGNDNEAVVIVGHGTDHPGWSAYPALENILRKTYGSRIFCGMVEEGFPERESIVADVTASGCSHVRLIPLLLVAGAHFNEDLAGEDENSWKSTFEKQGISVSLHPDGLGLNQEITTIFCRHIKEALDLIPETGSELLP